MAAQQRVLIVLPCLEKILQLVIGKRSLQGDHRRTQDDILLLQCGAHPAITSARASDT